MPNLDAATVQGFGYEWKHFDQTGASAEELQTIYRQYFSIFPWHKFDAQTAVGADFGCGSGRWSKQVAPKVGHLHLIDASAEALGVAKKTLEDQANVTFHLGSVEEAKLENQSLDFAYSLGVLHHVPDTLKALRDISKKLKVGAPFLLYLYYRFDNRPKWYGVLWAVSDGFRRGISHLPLRARSFVSFLFALGVYWPLARAAKLLNGLGRLPASFPLAFYKDRSFYVMRNDALDRLGTKVEKRFTRLEMKALMEQAGFEQIQFSECAPYWCAVGVRKSFGDGATGV